MNRQQSDENQQSYPDYGGQNHGIGLRAVAAAIRYQGDANNVGRSLKREASGPAARVTQSRDTES
jgi:hypothetical protein